MFRFLFLGCCLIAVSTDRVSGAAAGKRLMCYFSYDAPEISGYGRYTANEVPVELCSDVVYDGLDFPKWERGYYVFDNRDLQKYGTFLATIRARSGLVRNIFTLQDREKNSVSYSVMAEIPERRGAFVRAVLQLLEVYALDGVEIAWEWPGTAVTFGGTSNDRESIVSLLTDLKAGLRKSGKELIFFGAVYPKVLHDSYRVASICQLADFVTLFSYDLRPYTVRLADVHSPMRNRTFEREPNRAKTNVVTGVETWIKYGCPPKKLILGIGLFGHAVTLADPRQYNVGAPSTGPGAKGRYDYGAGYYPFHEQCLLLRSGWRMFYDPIGQMPFAVRGNQWMSYVDTNSIGVKIDFVAEKRLGGVVLWTIEYDDFWGFCGSRNPLTTYTYQRLQQIPSDIGFAIEWS
ncbi:endochitinase-like [Anopheles cruzii]|uniref:endochitinase-like n=1 Tax=Anopheles cruzii TaxID=68878 RepID=UPI0022EC6214|nr:endochitinase-like [Anopheles cruzii]